MVQITMKNSIMKKTITKNEIAEFKTRGKTHIEKVRAKKNSKESVSKN